MTWHGGRWNRGELPIVFLLLLVAAALRFVALGDAPRGLFRDEWEKGYTAHELWHTARHAVPAADGLEISRPLPIFIETYKGHDRTSALYQYLTAPVVGLFGLSAFTTRFLAALAGSLTCLFVWLIARRAFSPQAAVGALASITLHPTAIIFSRWAQQGSLAILFTTAGVWLLFEAIAENKKQQRRAVMAAAAMALGIAAYAYDPARLVVPAIVGLFLFVYRREAFPHWRAFLPAVFLFLAIWIPLFVYTLTSGSSRLSRVSGGLTVLEIVKNFAAHFSPGFWLLSGDQNPRHNLGLAWGDAEPWPMPSGFLGYGTALMVALGLVLVAIRLKKHETGTSSRAGIFLFLWLLAAPAAAALTNEGIPHALRACLMIPATSLIAGFALHCLADGRWCRAWVPVLLVVLGLDAVRTAVGLTLLGRTSSAAWNAGLIEEIRSDLQNGQKVYLSADIPYSNYAALFAEQTDPRKYHQENLSALKTRIVSLMPPFEEGDVHIQTMESAPYATSEMKRISSHMAIERNGPDLVVRYSDSPKSMNLTGSGLVPRPDSQGAAPRFKP
ncbi:glycosyltransferase family 39 protein [Candidatus Sumerlaeota bacterium]|nr:glycosyltransferase family 39 protein [Candidatus Sumerlaeota bacterium]